MTKIKVSLKEEVRKELLRERENYLFKSLLPLAEIEDPDLISDKFGETAISLLNEGYTPDEISQTIELHEDFWGNLKDKDGNFQFFNSIMGGLKSEFWETILVWLFSKVLGMGQATSQDLAVVLSEYNPLRILKLFKGYSACVEEVGGEKGLGMALVEMFINKSQFQGQERQPLGKDFFKITIRNVAAEAVRESDLDKKLAGKICGYIWNQSDGEEKQTKSQSQPNQSSQPPPKQGPANIRDN